MKKLLKLSAHIIVIQEIIHNTIFVLFFTFVNFIFLLIYFPLFFIIKAIKTMSDYVEEKTKIYCEKLQQLIGVVKINYENIEEE